MSSLVNYEQFVDNCADIFAMRLTEFAAKDEVLDLRHWLQCYAFDVIGEITYGERFGESRLDLFIICISKAIISCSDGMAQGFSMEAEILPAS